MPSSCRRNHYQNIRTAKWHIQTTHNHILKLEPVTTRGTGHANISISEPITSQHTYEHIAHPHYTWSKPPNKKRKTIKHVMWTRDEMKTICAEQNVKSGFGRLGGACVLKEHLAQFRSISHDDICRFLDVKRQWAVPLDVLHIPQCAVYLDGPQIPHSPSR